MIHYQYKHISVRYTLSVDFHEKCRTVKEDP